MKAPYLFDDFFASDQEESISPFLTTSSRKWAKHLPFKAACLSAALLVGAFLLPSLSSLLLLFVYLISGTPALLASLDDLKNLEINIDVLMTLAAFLAIAIDSSLEGALLLVLFALSHGLEETVSKKASSALNLLNHIAPKFATLIAKDGTVFEKKLSEVAIGEQILVKHGEIIPLDGIVTEGISSLNLVHISGESIPVKKEKGDEVPAGSRNLEMALTIQVTRTSRDSTLSRIIQLIKEAQEAKPKLQRLLDRFGKHYATTVITLTCLFALGLPLLFSMTYFGMEGSIYRALAFLIAASPCALIIATPTAYLSAISSSAKKGILLKGGATLDALASCSLIAFDKTGTLTTGKLECISEEIPDEALSIAYGLERNVVHPIATAICAMAEKRKLSPTSISRFRSIAGHGVEGMANGDFVAIGSPSFIGIETKGHGVLAALKVKEKTYLFRFVDQMREKMAHTIRSLPLKPILLTGDREENAHHAASLLGIQEVHANLKPEDKLDKVASFAETAGLAMVGDGINDAPALARATVGISMGRLGSAVAIDASDVVLLNDDIHLLGWLFLRAKKTLRIVRQNLCLALGVIVFASIPALFGLLPLWLAVILHEGGTLLVGLNSLRLLKR